MLKKHFSRPALMTIACQDQPPAHFNMARYCLASAAKNSPQKPALILVDDACSDKACEIWTFEELEDAVLRLASALEEEGMRRGSRLLINLGNCSETALLFFACLAAGFIPLLVSEQLSRREIDHLLADSKPQAIALSDALASSIKPPIKIFSRQQIRQFIDFKSRADYVETLANDPAFLIYTSGTSAAAKGVLHAHRSAWGRRPMYRDWYDIKTSDRMLHAGALNWSYTLGVGLTDPWANGATSLIYTGPKDPTVWPRLIERYQMTLFAAVPSLYRQILKYADIGSFDLRSLRHGLTAGEALSPSIAEAWLRHTGKHLYEAFGMSELSTFISSSPSRPAKEGSAGRPQRGRSIAILPFENGGNDPLPVGQTGLLAAHRSDPGLMLGYWNKEREKPDLLEGEWFLTSDIASIDEDGSIYHQGRADEVMNAFGYRVSPFEVEHVLSKYEGVSEVGVAEIRLRNDLTVIGAFLVADGNSELVEEALRDYASKHLAHYKVPKKFIFVESLPKTANGKIKRRQLSSRLVPH